MQLDPMHDRLIVGLDVPTLAEAEKVLARYELPDELRVLDALPRTPAGKVDLAAVRELFTVEP